MAVLNNQLSGTFTSTGSRVWLPIPSDVDYMEVINYTQMATQQNPGRGVLFKWYRGMAADTGVEFKKTNSTDVLNGTTLASGGFTLINTTDSILGSPLAVTGISDANPAVVTLASTAGLSNGDVVRVYGSNQMLQIAGMEFTISNLVANTSFDLAYLDSSGFAQAANAGHVQKVFYPPYWTPSSYFITGISQAANAVITLSVAHNLEIGERVVFNIPAAFGMSQLNGLRGQVVDFDNAANTVTVNIDTTGFTAFAFPVSGAVPFTFAQLIPFGDAPYTVANPQGNQSVLDGALRNQGFIGMQLAAGVNSPAGSNNDVIYWQATKSSQYSSGLD